MALGYPPTLDPDLRRHAVTHQELSHTCKRQHRNLDKIQNPDLPAMAPAVKV